MSIKFASLFTQAKMLVQLNEF